MTLTSRLHHPRWCLGACRLHGRPFEECRHRELLCSHVVMHRPEQPHLGKEKPKTTYTKPNEGHKICRRPVAAVPCRSSQHCRSFSSSARSSPHQAVKPSNLHPYVFHNHDTSTTNNHARTSRVSTGTGSCVVVDDRPNRMVVTFVRKRATQERVDTLARQATRSLVAAWRPTMNDERRRDVGQQTTTTQQQHRLRSSVNFETLKLSSFLNEAQTVAEYGKRVLYLVFGSTAVVTMSRNLHCLLRASKVNARTSFWLLCCQNSEDDDDDNNVATTTSTVDGRRSVDGVVDGSIDNGRRRAVAPWSFQSVTILASCVLPSTDNKLLCLASGICGRFGVLRGRYVVARRVVARRVVSWREYGTADRCARKLLPDW